MGKMIIIPLIPLDAIGEYIDCQQCGNTYEAEVLNYKPKGHHQLETQAGRVLK